MQTHFSPAQLADPEIQDVNAILRSCVHCGYCLATCPTYLLLGDELDSPRGRIYLAKQMLEGDETPSAKVVKHLDRCLTCLNCLSTCPSSVNYEHLIHHARTHIERRYTRPLPDRWLRRALGRMLPDPRLFRLGLLAGAAGRPFRKWLPKPMRAMLDSLPERLPTPSAVTRPQVFAAEGPRRMRVALALGCAQQVLLPAIDEATVRILTRHGCEVVIVGGAGCCGAIVHHFGWADEAKRAAAGNVAAWSRELATSGLDAVVFTASGCGVMLREYGYLLRDNPTWRQPAADIAEKCKDVTEILLALGLQQPTRTIRLNVAYQMPCTMQHGLKLRTTTKELLAAAGFTVREPEESHLCCGSAGTYSITEPEISLALRDRKLAALAATGPDVIASSNIGCIRHLAGASRVPVIHAVELLDWATGGPVPAALAGMAETTEQAAEAAH